VLGREVGVCGEAAPKSVCPGVILEQIERRELGQIEPVVKDQGRLDPAVRHEDVVSKREQCCRACHGSARQQLLHPLRHLLRSYLSKSASAE
jgi:hypothetical protein